MKGPKLCSGPLSQNIKKKLENNMEWIPAENCTQCPQNLKCLRPLAYRKPLLCVQQAVTNLTTFLREGPATITPSTILLPFILLITSLLITILILQIIILAQPSRSSSRSPKRCTTKKVRKGAGRLVERSPPVPVSPPSLMVDARRRAFRARRAITFQQEVNQQWAVQEEHPEVVYDTVATQFEEDEEDDEF